MPFRFNPFTDKLDLTDTGGSGGGITTINGDTGSITGTTVTVYTNNSTINSGASLKFVNSGTVSTLNVTDASDNTIIGKGAGNATLSGGSNTGLGRFALNALTSGNSNTALGSLSLAACTSSPDNTGIGAGSLFSVTSGSGFNTALGNTSLNQLATGANNVALGSFAGDLYVGAESNNILVLNEGTPGESNTTRIGTQGNGTRQQNRCFVAGITGASPTGANAPQVVLCDNAGQLTPITSDTAGFVLTSNGTGTTPTFQASGAGGVTCLFSAYLSSIQSNVTGDGTTYDIICDTESFDIGGDYNNATGIFTAPSNGYYMFVYAVNSEGITSSHTEGIISLNTNAERTWRGSPFGCADAGGALTFNCSKILNLSAGNGVKLSYYVNGGAKVVDVQSTWTFFSGYKIA